MGLIRIWQRRSGKLTHFVATKSIFEEFFEISIHNNEWTIQHVGENKKNSYSYCNQVMARTKLGSRKVPRAKKDHGLKSTAKLFSTEESETKCLNSKNFYHISRRWRKIKQGERVVRIINNRSQYLFIFILRHVNSVWLILKCII